MTTKLFQMQFSNMVMTTANKETQSYRNSSASKWTITTGQHQRVLVLPQVSKHSQVEASSKRTRIEHVRTMDSERRGRNMFVCSERFLCTVPNAFSIAFQTSTVLARTFIRLCSYKSKWSLSLSYFRVYFTKWYN